MDVHRITVAAISTVILGATACAPPSVPTTTTTTSTTTSTTSTTTSTTTTTVPGPWLAAGCLDGAGTNGIAAPDLLYNGTPNQRANARFFAVLANGTLTFSGNGTCSGTPWGAITIVRAPSAAQAGALCASLNSGPTATSFTGSAWTAPADAWACSETILL